MKLYRTFPLVFVGIFCFLLLSLINKIGQKSSEALKDQNCQRQFNNEFNFPTGTNLPVPMSIYQKGNTLVMIFSLQNLGYDHRRNVSSLLISDYEKWFQTPS